MTVKAADTLNLPTMDNVMVNQLRPEQHISDHIHKKGEGLEATEFLILVDKFLYAFVFLFNYSRR